MHGGTERSKRQGKRCRTTSVTGHSIRHASRPRPLSVIRQQHDVTSAVAKPTIIRPFTMVTIGTLARPPQIPTCMPRRANAANAAFDCCVLCTHVHNKASAFSRHELSRCGRCAGAQLAETWADRLHVLSLIRAVALDHHPAPRLSCCCCFPALKTSSLHRWTTRQSRCLTGRPPLLHPLPAARCQIRLRRRRRKR